MQPNMDKLKQIEQQNKRINEKLAKIKNRIVVFSGKGGVGKTTVSVNLSYALLKQNKKVGLLDADITGPNVPKMVGAEDIPIVSGESKQIQPQVKDDLQIISIAPMIPKDTPVIWRGPLRSATISQFLADVQWGELDYLLADLPPGTGDEVLTINQQMKPQLAIVVTTPQEVSLMDCKRAVNMAKKMNIAKIAVIENMSGLICPHCDKKIDLFGSGGGKAMAKELGVEFLGKIPMEIEARNCCDKGTPIVLKSPDCKISQAFRDISTAIENLLEAV